MQAVTGNHAVVKLGEGVTLRCGRGVRLGDEQICVVQLLGNPNKEYTSNTNKSNPTTFLNYLELGMDLAFQKAKLKKIILHAN